MSLYIKNIRAESLARELAQLTQTTLTDTVTMALEAMLTSLKRRVRPASRAATLRAICQQCSALPDVDARSAEAILDYSADGTFAGDVHGD